MGTVINNRFELNSFIADGGTGKVYRALDRETGREAAVKVLGSGASRRAQDIIRYHCVLEIISRINHPSVVRVLGHDVTRMSGRPHWIATELVRGPNLYDFMKGAGILSVETSISVVEQVCSALAAVHDKGVVHGDLKPGNILLIEINDQPAIKLIDFGMSHMREPGREADAGYVSGTFRYLSPEQCGILRLPVDERSDLYSLGVLFYEMLTGVTPFPGDSLMEVLHRQAASMPEIPSRINPAMPEILDRIVMKLLEKEPELRYQTATGLLCDLNRTAAGERDFPLGKHDEVKLDFRTAIIGRDAEISRLVEIIDAARERRGSVVLLAGESGAGKTRLASELRQHALASGMAFIEGRCGGEGNEPLSAFRQALADYLRTWRSYPALRRDVVGRYMRATGGSLGGIVIGFMGETREILGQCPEVVPLDADRETRRFNVTLSRFYLDLAGAEGSLVLFLDDLHKADGGTLRLMAEIAKQVSEIPIVVVGAFRDSEVQEDHPLRELLADDACAIEPVRNLDEPGIRDFIRGILPVEGPDLNDLAGFVFKRSGGNPLFAIEMLKQILREKVMTCEDRQVDV